MQRLPTPMLAAILAAPLLAALLDASRAEDAAPATSTADRPGRYTMVPAEGGFVRLDTETGTVSQCRRDGDATPPSWRCTEIPEATISETAPQKSAIDAAARDLALSQRIDGLAATTAELTRRVAALETEAAAAKRPALGRVGGFAMEALRRVRLLAAEWKGVAADPERPAVVRP